MANLDEIIIQHFGYLKDDFGFHIDKREFDPSRSQRANVIFKSSVIGVQVAVDRNEAYIWIGDKKESSRNWLDFGFVLKYYAPFITQAYEIPEYVSGYTWLDMVLPQLDRLAKLLREHCRPLLNGDLSGMETMVKMAKESNAKMIAQFNKRSEK